MHHTPHVNFFPLGQLFRSAFANRPTERRRRDSGELSHFRKWEKVQFHQSLLIRSLADSGHSAFAPVKGYSVFIATVTEGKRNYRNFFKKKVRGYD